MKKHLGTREKIWRSSCCLSVLGPVETTCPNCRKECTPITLLKIGVSDCHRKPVYADARGKRYCAHCKRECIAKAA